MTIAPENVKLYESQVLSDEDDGGGRATGNVVVDGLVNNLFQDISRIDRAVGDVSLRKFFAGVDTNNADVYLGVHAIITSPPADPNVHVVLFDAGSESDERLEAQNRIESYVVQGAEAQWSLQGNQFEGQRTLVGFQREEQSIPEVGDVFLLRDEATSNEQYVRITEVAHAIQSYTIQVSGNFIDFKRRRLDLGISAPLEFTFPGGEVRPEGPSSPHSDVFSTEIANAARYWGVTTSADPIVSGDVQIKANSIFSNLVPSAQAESPVLDQPVYPGDTVIEPASDTSLTDTFQLNYVSGTEVRGYLNRPANRGSVAITISGSLYTDNGSGVLARSSGGAPWGELAIDYGTGQISGFRDSGTGTGVVTGSVTYLPGGPFAGRRISESTAVNINNRGFNWIETFAQDKPKPGTFTVEYMALGKWYTVSDRGDGVLEGIGSGSVNFVTGTANVTLEALPDIGSEIIWSYIVDIDGELETHQGNLAVQPEYELTIDPGAAPGSVSIDYIAGSTTYSVTDAANVGVLAGDGEGEIDYGAGIITLRPDLIPDDATDIVITYDFDSANTYTIASPSLSGNVLSGTIPNAPLKPGSVTFEAIARYVWNASSGALKSRLVRVSDDGAGGFAGGVVGTINYSSGAFTVELVTDFQFYEYSYSVAAPGGGSYRQTSQASINRSETLQGSVIVKYQQATAAANSGSTTVSPSTLQLKVVDTRGDLIPSSLLFDWGGQRYFDRDGVMYRGFSSDTGAGTAVGTIDYASSLVTFNTWPAGAAPGVNVLAALTSRADILTDSIVMRTPGAPLRPQSYSITVTDESSAIISETADLAGEIDSAKLQGQVNYESGVAKLTFTDGSNPVFVYPDSARYNAIIFSFLPLDADLIGLDPVRLPSDGRVPIFRKGDVIVIGDPQEYNAGTPTDGQVVSVGRTNLASIQVVDANGATMDPAQYTANRLAGTVTFENPVVLQQADTTPLVTPITIKHRIEHMSVVNDVQITGELSFIAPAGFDFPAGSTISSAKVWGNVNARVYNFFTQRTWNSGAPNWTDQRIGDDTTANFNVVDNPIEYANNGAVTERWAIVFTSSTGFSIVGETLGVIGTGTTSIDVAPQNPNTGNPYFVMRAAGFGSGWAAGNVIRFDTDGCLAPGWLARTVLSAQGTEDDDAFTLQIRGDAD